MKKVFFIILVYLSITNFSFCQCDRRIFNDFEAFPGAFQTEQYLPMLQGKHVGIVTNHTGKIGDRHLVDSLLSLDIKIVRIFSPEHGFRGDADEGASIQNGTDVRTGLPIVSLYGNNKKPTAEQLQGLDVMVFDLQDVGVRFYTYISTLTYVMEACAENGIPLIVFDRPNPNGFYVDGPVLEAKNSSFVGLHSVPVVYGMTIGEYALMVNGEGWLRDGVRCDLNVVAMQRYDRGAIYKLSAAPSPNLRSWQAIFLYPSLCFFEGSVVSVGRGTENPFTIYGHPQMNEDFSFTPQTKPNHNKVLLDKQQCFGENLLPFAEKHYLDKGKIHLEWLINAHNQLKDKTKFFNNFFVKLAGTDKLQKQIEEGISEKEIRRSWQKDLRNFKKIREKYLIY